MKIDKMILARLSKEEIIQYLISKITSKPGIKPLQQDGIKKARKFKTHLKIIVIKSNGLSPADLRERLSELRTGDYKNKVRYARFFDDNMIIVTPLSPLGIFHLSIQQKGYRVTYDFIIIAEGDYWLIFTFSLSKKIPGTIQKIIASLPELEIIKLLPSQIEEIVRKDYSTQIRGFLAKYETHRQGANRKITVDVFGGTLEDLDKFRGIYFVEPYNISFGLHNSPEVHGKIDARGFYSLESVMAGGEDLAYKTIISLGKTFERINDETYEKVTKFDNAVVHLKNDGGLTVRSECAFVFKIKDQRFEKDQVDPINIMEFNDKMVKYFQNKSRYIFYSDEQYSHILLDKLTRNKLQVVVDPDFKTLVIYPYKNCIGKTIRDFVTKLVANVEASIVKQEDFCITC